MAWTIKVSDVALKSMRKLDKQVARRIRKELNEIAQLEDPRSKRKALVGNYSGLWRYRVGDYRIVCDIEDGALIVLVVAVAHRKDVYRKELQ